MTNAAKSQAGIYNIPSGTAFAKALAAQLIFETKDRPEALADYRILLPTRRAGRVLRQAFLDLLQPGQFAILPRLQTLGDVDEEELSLSIAGQDAPDDLLQIPPSLSPLKRRILLAQTVQKIPGYARSFDQALLLADALGHLMDQVYTENLDFAKLAELAPDDFADHWQVTLKFMTILTELWPAVLAENGVIDAANRRNRLLQSLADHWSKSPPQGPVIAAGTTGSIPGVATLLKVIAALPQGRVVLPGLDPEIDDESWDNLDETHPQSLLKNLLTKLEIDRQNVAAWPGSEEHKNAAARRVLSREIMRPSETTGAWTDTLRTSKLLQQTLKSATQDLRLLTCSNEREEANAIAALLRKTLEDPGHTAALITPRRSLARRIAATCRRWDIAVDDSAGLTLDQAPIGVYLRLSARAAADHFSPVSLLAFLKHPFCGVEGLPTLDKDLRGPKPAPGLAGITSRDTAGIMGVIGPHLDRFMAGSPPEKPRPFGEILTSHIELVESLARDPEILWSGDAGDEASRFLADLQDHAHLLPSMSLGAYTEILTTLLHGVNVRAPWGVHPRLHIFGQLEARMIDADLVIMAGLNEGTWPDDPGHDPWMSRPMRSTFGLPPAERQIGLAAHDFVQGLCAPNVVITRSLRQDGGPTVPARWLPRLSAVLDAAAIPEDTIHDSTAILWANGLDTAAKTEAWKRPAPTPPVAQRPREMSVTQIEKWQQDPYSIYAKYILGLEPLLPLEKPVEAAEKGTLLHKIMSRFVEQVPAAIPPNAQQILTTLAAEEIAKRSDDPAVWSFWRRRFDKTAHWLVQHETAWRTTAKPLKTEVKGQTELRTESGRFILKARADRIDSILGGAAVIDYKSGGNHSKSALDKGKLPQLPLEGLILVNGGYDGMQSLTPLSLQYWKLTASLKPDEKPVQSTDAEALIERAQSGLLALITAFDNENTPYYSVPNPAHAPRFNDYKHLARIAEWGALGDDDTGSEAA